MTTHAVRIPVNLTGNGYPSIRAGKADTAIPWREEKGAISTKG